MFKTLLHPDLRRAWAEVFVVAIDVAQVRLHLVAGAVDPEATTPAGRAAARPAVVPQEDRGAIVAAFNGGFKTEHGHFGMRVDGVTFAPARAVSCTVAAYADGVVRIGSWTALAETEPSMLWWRQTPPCLVEGGNVPSAFGDIRQWGRSVGGDTVIRRSAIGTSRAGDVLYVGMGESVTAPTLARAMQHAGASDAAQLDVNWSFPKFLVYRANAAGALDAVGLFPGFAFQSDDYVRRRAPKDFFYLVRR
jgi:hypothetical protein